MAAEVTPIRPTRAPSCYLCLHGEETGRGVLCTLVEELILDEKGTAVDCETYLEDPGAR